MKKIYLIGIYFIWCALSILIIYYHPNGRVYTDSSYYLRNAVNIKFGHLELSAWPIGYPAVLATISLITKLDIFWVSKLLNFILVGLILILLYKIYPKNFFILGLIVFTGDFWSIFVTTWSEPLFIFLIFVFIYLVYLIEYKNEKNWGYIITILIISIYAFLVRYIGVFLGVFFFFLIIKNLYLKRKDKVISYSLILIVFSVIVLGYMLLNLKYTGSFSGEHRNFSEQSVVEVLADFIIAFLQNLSFIGYPGRNMLLWYLTLAIGVVIFFFFIYTAVIKKGWSKFISNSNSFKGHYFLMLMSIIIYLGILLTLKCLFSFDHINFRLIFPAMFFVDILIINFFLFWGYKNRKMYVKKLLLILLFLSFIINGPLRIVYYVKKYKMSYKQNISNLKKKFSRIPSQSIIFFGSPHLRYLFPSLEILYPAKNSFNKVLKASEEKTKNLYLYVPSKFDILSYVSVANAFKNHKRIFSKYPLGALIKINSESFKK